MGYDAEYDGDIMRALFLYDYIHGYLKQGGIPNFWNEHRAGREGYLTIK